MKKIYSFVLMVAMLLIGTNAWATDPVATVSINGATATELETSAAVTDALLALADGDVAVFTLQQNVTLGYGEKTGSQWFDGAKSITFNLNGKSIDCYIRFNLKQASLYIQGSGTVDMKIANLFAATYGSKNKAEAYGYSTLEIGENVIINSANQYALGLFPRDYADATYTGSNTKCNQQLEQDDWSVKYGAGAGVTINIYGKVYSKYGVSSNGQLAATVGNVPVVNIYEDAYINTSDYNGIYAGGYAIWNIQGKVEGLTGIYAKGGVFNLNGAEIIGNGEYEKPTENNNGTSGGGSGIVLDGNAAYAGHMELHVTGDTKVTSNEGYAMEELTTSANESQTDSLVIASGEFNGDVHMGSLTMTTELGQDVQINGTITGGIYNSDIAEYLSPTEGAIQQTANGYEVVAGCVSILNDYGLATFSSPNYNVVLPEDLNVWIVTSGLDGEGKLTLEQVVLSAGAILPKETGFILEGTANKAYSFIKSTADATTGNLDANALLSSDKFDDAAKPVYILHDTELWLYEGTVFKEGKAFLPASLFGAGAPKRIQMVFAETQAVENVEVEAVKAEKFIENGQVLIKRGEKVYNVQGQIVK